MLTLYTYWRSSAAYRVRIALALKELTANHIPVHLLKDGGQQKAEPYRGLNPAMLVPTLQHDDLTLNQSLAIIEYLDATFPRQPLLPAEPAQAAVVRALALDIACDIHPLNNLRVLQYLSGTLGISDLQKTDWILHWLRQGFTALEQRLNQTAGLYACGDTVTLADVCLVPQVYNALRFQLELTPFPQIVRIYQQCMTLPAFIAAAPEQQADAQA
ncbi:maleylacetoacetate isomerase [Rheinheimera texasensis]|uniref:maleylacetoacetate isomerase n=1 Tax=Rheinheimera texasensis TaxID=306205 RepID=UPI000A5F3ED5|nr:maleylacetoacetate isomerase [Rheinheimera texasensis]